MKMQLAVRRGAITDGIEKNSLTELHGHSTENINHLLLTRAHAVELMELKLARRKSRPYLSTRQEAIAKFATGLRGRLPCEHLVAFSCKRRGFCPSCGARRMAESAALLVDEVLPEQPIRQLMPWMACIRAMQEQLPRVLSFPFQLRYLFARRYQRNGCH